MVAEWRVYPLGPCTERNRLILALPLDTLEILGRPVVHGSDIVMACVVMAVQSSMVLT